MADYQLTQTGQEVQTALDKVGTVALDTTSSNLSGAVNELKSSKANIANQTMDTPTLAWGLNSNANISSTPRAEIRRAGSVGSYGVSLITVDGGTTKYNSLVDKDGNFLPDYVMIRSIQEVTVSTSSSIANGSTGTLTGTMTAVANATRYVFIPTRCNYGIFTTTVTRSNNTLSVTVMNVSGASHTMQGTVVVIAI